MPSAPTVVSGIRSSEVGILQARRVVDMRDHIYDFDPSATPFLTTLSRRLSSVQAQNPVYNHIEDQPLPWWDTMGTTFSPATTGTTATVANGAYFRGGDLVVAPASTGVVGEIFKVVSVAGNVLTCVRDYTNTGTTGGTIANSSFLAIIGNVNEEHATKRTIKSTTETAVQNFTQIFRDPMGSSNTLQGAKLYGGSERTRQRKKQATQHNLQRERAFLFGKKKEATGPNGNRERATGGMIQWISANITNVNGTLTQQVLETWCQGLFRYGSATRLIVGSRLFASELDNIAEAKLQTVPKADTYGVQMSQYVTAHGTLMVSISDQLINSYAGYAFAIDLENVFMRHMEDDDGVRNARLRTNIQDPSADGWEDEYLSEVGLHVTLADTHGYLYGIT